MVYIKSTESGSAIRKTLERTLSPKALKGGKGAQRLKIHKILEKKIRRKFCLVLAI